MPDASANARPVVHEAEIGEALAHRLTTRVTMEIERAEAADGFGLDGVSYSFRTGDSRCAETGNPEPGTRQVKRVAVIQGLAEGAHASRRRSRARALASVDCWPSLATSKARSARF